METIECSWLQKHTVNYKTPDWNSVLTDSCCNNFIISSKIHGDDCNPKFPVFSLKKSILNPRYIKGRPENFFTQFPSKVDFARKLSHMSCHYSKTVSSTKFSKIKTCFALFQILRKNTWDRKLGKKLLRVTWVLDSVLGKLTAVRF